MNSHKQEDFGDYSGIKSENQGNTLFQKQNQNGKFGLIKKIQSKFKDDNSFLTCYIMVAMISFSQGVLNLSDISIQFMYKDDFLMSPSQLSIVQGITQLPWIFKPFFGVISDCLPFCGYRRKSYLILFGLISFICWNCLAYEVTTDMYVGISCILFNQVCVAFCNVIGEALLVEISQKKAKVHAYNEEQQQQDAAKNVSLFFFCKSFGTLITAYLGGYLLERVDKHQIFHITSFFPLMICITALFMQEQTDKQKNSVASAEDQIGFEQMQKFVGFIKLPYIYKPILFVFLFMMTPNSGSTMFFFYTNKLGFEPEFLGELKLFYALASITGMIIYNKFLKLVEFKKQFVFSAFAVSCLGMSQILLVTRKNIELGIPDKVFSLGDSVIIQVAGELNILPMLVLACRLCPKNIEGTMYAVIMSTFNCGNIIAQQLGGLIAYQLGITQDNFDNLWLAIFIANITTILPLVFINLVQMEKVEETKALYQEQKSYYQDQKSFATVLNESIDEITSLIGNQERLAV